MNKKVRKTIKLLNNSVVVARKLPKLALYEYFSVLHNFLTKFDAVTEAHFVLGSVEIDPWGIMVFIIYRVGLEFQQQCCN